PARRGRDAVEVELAQGPIVARELAFALQDVDLDARLAVGRGREHLALRGRDGRVPLDELREHAPERLDAERERGHVEQDDVADLAAEDPALDRRADANRLVGVDALVRFAAEDLLRQVADRRDSRAAADEDDLVDLRGLESSVLERLQAGSLGAVD